MTPVGRRHNNSHWFARNGPTQSNVCVAVQFNLKMDNKSTEKWRQVFGSGDSACRSVGDAIHTTTVSAHDQPDDSNTYRRWELITSGGDQSGGDIKATGGVNETRTGCRNRLTDSWHVQRASIIRLSGAPYRVSVTAHRIAGVQTDSYLAFDRPGKRFVIQQRWEWQAQRGLGKRQRHVNYCCKIDINLKFSWNYSVKFSFNLIKYFRCPSLLTTPSSLTK